MEEEESISGRRSHQLTSFREEDSSVRPPRLRAPGFWSIWPALTSQNDQNSWLDHDRGWPITRGQKVCRCRHVIMKEAASANQRTAESRKQLSNVSAPSRQARGHKRLQQHLEIWRNLDPNLDPTSAHRRPGNQKQSRENQSRQPTSQSGLGASPSIWLSHNFCCGQEQLQAETFTTGTSLWSSSVGSGAMATSMCERDRCGLCFYGCRSSRSKLTNTPIKTPDAQEGGPGVGWNQNQNLN